MLKLTLPLNKTKLVGKILDLKEKEIFRDEENLDIIEKLADSLEIVKKELSNVSLQKQKQKNIEEEITKIYQFLNDLEMRLEELEGKKKAKKNSKSTLDDYDMRYG